MTEGEYEIERDGDDYVAIHERDRRKNVRIDGEWTEKEMDSVYAPWEGIIHSLVQSNPMDVLDVDSTTQEGKIDIEEACKQMIADGVAENEDHARGIVETLVDQDVFELSDGKIVLFVNPSDVTSNKDYLFNWAAVIEATADRIEAQIDRAREMDQTLQKRLDDAKSDRDIQVESKDPQTQINEINRKLQSLGDPNTNEVPPPEEMSREDQIQYKHLRRKSRIARSRRRFTEGQMINTTQADPEEVMSRGIENFEELLVGFDEYHEEIRTSIALEMWNDEDIVDLLDGLVDMLGHVALLDQSMEEESHDEFVSTMNDLSDESEATVEPVQNLQEKQDEEEREQAERQVEAQSEGRVSDQFASEPTN
jgi:hypothetical protein